MITALAQKLSGKQIENMVIELHDARQMLHDIIDAIKRLEVLVAGNVASERKNNQAIYPNEDVRKAEVVKRLENNNEYISLKEKLQDARMNLAFVEAELEKEKANHAGMVAITGLMTAMISKGQDKALSNLEVAISTIFSGKQEYRADKETAVSVGGQTANRQSTQGFPQQQNAAANAEADEELETGIFKVLEVRESSPGTIRGYSEAEDGSKVALYGKNGIGRTIAGAVDKYIQVWYKRGNKGLICTSARIVK